MYKVLVVDDEELICMGIKHKIQRLKNPEIGEIFIAFDGHEALRLVLSIHPQIIITDMSMPGMNGLDLIKKVLTHFPDVKFIVLSGYDDFLFVKPAFKMGIVDYILKPARINKLRDVLELAIQTIKGKEIQEKKQEMDTCKSHRAKIENALNRVLFKGNLPDSDLQKVFEGLEIIFPYKYFCICIFTLDNNSLKLEEEDELNCRIMETINWFCDSKDISVVEFYCYDNNHVTILNCLSEKYYKTLMECLEKVSSQLMENMCPYFLFSISGIQEGVSSLISLYRQAEEALKYRIFNVSGSIIEYGIIKSNKHDIEFYDKTFRKLEKEIRSCTNDKASDCIDEIFNRDTLKNYSIYAVQKLYTKVADIIMEVMNEANMQGNKFIFKDFYSHKTLCDLKIYLKNTIFQLIKSIKMNFSEESFLDDVKKILEGNLHRDTDMTVVANMMNINYSYFSKVFKRKTGVKFSEYLTRIRMEKAKDMLCNSAFKINEIAPITGYANPKNFTRAFKKYYGVSPKMYKTKFSNIKKTF